MILSAWKLLQQYFDHLRRAYRRRVELARQVAEQPSQRSTGSSRGGADDRERRLVVVADRRALAQELGLEAQVEIDAVASCPIRARRSGAAHLSTVPGTSVDRKTKTCGAGLSRIARPRCRGRAAASRVWSWLPLGADGVPTQISEISAAEHRLAHIARDRDAGRSPTTLAIRSTMPSSTTGVFPSRIRSSLAGRRRRR